ncbi:MAG: ATP-binding domain-containing protein, partial [Peptococcaceae bacterium]|nr:ATP-binding domain-containing protein [Peptococcaceae bacterium]
ILLLGMQAGQMSVADLTEAVLGGTGYRLELITENTIESSTRLENLAEFVSATKEYDRREGANGSLLGFLEAAALVNQSEMTDDEADFVRLMTLHSAKGLEFPVVFISGMEEGIFPHSRSMEDDSELEEERRLCYVGITRAMERLYLTYCRERYTYGNKSYNDPSRFLWEIPPHLMESTGFY